MSLRGNGHREYLMEKSQALRKGCPEFPSPKIYALLVQKYRPKEILFSSQIIVFGTEFPSVLGCTSQLGLHLDPAT